MLAVLGLPQVTTRRLPASASPSPDMEVAACRLSPDGPPLKSLHTSYPPPKPLTSLYVDKKCPQTTAFSNYPPSPLESLHCRLFPMLFHPPRASSSEKPYTYYTYLIPSHGPAT